MSEYKSTESWPCRLCFDYGRVMLRLTPTPIANSFPDHPDLDAPRYPLEVQECLNCGHVQLRHKVQVDWTDYRYATPEAVRPHLTDAAQRLRQRYPQAVHVLEIGSNNGLYLEALQKVGFRPLGVDPCAPVAGNTIAAPFTSALAATLPPVDLIVANNVLAHVDDLHDVFRGIDRLLKDDGALVFEVQYLPAMMASGAFDMIYHEHRDYHTLGPLVKFLRRFGLIIDQYEEIETHGGSMRVYCERPGIGQMNVFQENLDWRGFAKRIEREKSKLQEAIKEAEHPIVAFGATAKACTLIHHFDLAEHIDFCVDDTPAKMGRYIPGTAIQIRPTGCLPKHATIFLTAWNYAEQIQANYPHYDYIIPFKEAPCLSSTK